MIHYTGWYFCTKSNWDNEVFDARNIISIEQESDDFNNLIEKISLYPNDEFNSLKGYYKLKPEVFLWLEENVKNEKDNLKGWCCGNNEYNLNSYENFSLFFYRRKDAINFIKTWSVHKKPTETFNQNTYVRKILDKETNTLKVFKK